MRPTSRYNDHIRSDDGQTHRHTHSNSTYRMGRVKNLDNNPYNQHWCINYMTLLSTTWQQSWKNHDNNPDNQHSLVHQLHHITPCQQGSLALCQLQGEVRIQSTFESYLRRIAHEIYTNIFDFNNKRNWSRAHLLFSSKTLFDGEMFTKFVVRKYQNIPPGKTLPSVNSKLVPHTDKEKIAKYGK